MSGLNFDVDEGLEDDTILVANTDDNFTQPEVTNQDLFGVDVIDNEVPKFTAEFVINADRANKIADLEEVRTAIEAINGISKEDAELVDSLSPGFLNEDRPLGYFTDKKSGTQLKESMNTIDGALDKDLMILRAGIESFCMRAQETLGPVVASVEQKTTELVIQQQTHLIGLLNVFPGGCIDNFRYYFNSGATIGDLLNERYWFDFDEGDAPQYTPDIDKVFCALARNKNSVSARINVRNILSIVPNTKLVYIGIDTWKISDKAPFLEKAEYNLATDDTSFGHAVERIVGPLAREWLESLAGVATNSLNALNEVLEELKETNEETEESLKDKLNKLVALNDKANLHYLQTYRVCVAISDYLTVARTVTAVVKAVSQISQGT